MNKLNPKIVHEITSPPACGLIVKSKDGFVLLTRRSDSMKTLPGSWSVPSGEVDVNSLESLDDCARREFTEETGYQFPPQQKIILLEKYLCYDRVYYLFFTKVDKRFRIQLDWEHEEYNWFHPSKLPTPMSDELLHAISKIENY